MKGRAGNAGDFSSLRNGAATIYNEMNNSVLDLVRAGDPDRFLCALFASPTRRPALLAVLAINLEVAVVRERAREPLLGEMRLQWWRDGLEAVFDGQTVDHPVLRALAAERPRADWARDDFLALIAARRRDLDDRPTADLADFEAYARSTAGPLARLSLAALGIDGGPAAEAAERAAIGWALTGLLRSAAAHRAQGRRLLPRPPDSMAGDAAVAAGAATRARAHLAAARRLRAEVPRDALPLLLPCWLAEGQLDDLARVGFDPMHPRLARPSGGGRRLGLVVRALFNRY